MSMTLYQHICFFELVNENKYIFLSDDNIWKCQNKKAIYPKPIEVPYSNFQDFLNLLYTFKRHKNECRNHTRFKNRTFQIRPGPTFVRWNLVIVLRYYGYHHTSTGSRRAFGSQPDKTNTLIWQYIQCRLRSCVIPARNL